MTPRKQCLLSTAESCTHAFTTVVITMHKTCTNLNQTIFQHGEGVRCKAPSLAEELLAILSCERKGQLSLKV